MIFEFSPYMFPRLGFYVYGLIDPRDNKTFYIGKGKENRVFAHAKDELKKFEEDEDELTTKLRTIRHIRNLDLQPKAVIFRHGLTEEQAFLVESVLIDVYKTEGLTNLMMGHGSDDVGYATVAELFQRYQKETMVIPDGLKVMVVKINRTFSDHPIYEATQCAWLCSLKRAKQAKYVFAVRQGVCIGVFLPEEWKKAYKKDFPQLSEDMPNRWGFFGREESPEIAEKYKNKLLCLKSFKQNTKAQNSILYNYKL